MIRHFDNETNFMKKPNFALFFIFIFLLVIVSSCGKYEEDPYISFQTKEKRLINTWEVSEILKNGEIHEFSGNIVYVFGEDGTGSCNFLAVDSYLEWKFDENKEQILIRLSSDGEFQSYKILRLTKDELWMQFNLDEDLITYKCLPKLLE